MRAGGWNVRAAENGDVEGVVRLVGQLGYACEVEEMRERLERLLGSEMDLVRVAQGDGGEIVGWVHGVVVEALESGRRVEIVGLVVDEACRGGGIGTALVEAVEAWTRSCGVGEVGVRCREEREEARAFYAARGFAEVKRQAVLRKRLYTSFES